MAQTPQSTDPRQRALAIMARREELENELKEQERILRQNDVNMRTPLVDEQGFPRNDIDVYAVRHARVRIIELNNDIKAVMNEMAEALNTVYEPSAEDTSIASSSSTAGGITSGGPGAAPHPDRDLKPFARVNGVMPGSPAADAGLLREDLILQFGTLTSEGMPSSLQPIAQLVSSHENRSIVIRIRRAGPDGDGLLHDRDLNFTPRKWGGRGLLGCHIVPMT